MRPSLSANSGSEKRNQYAVFRAPAPSGDVVTAASQPLWRLGLDYGTCWSKGVLWGARGGGGPAARVLRSPGAGGDHRIPARVALLRGRLYFGAQAEGLARTPGVVSYPSLKARLFEPERFEGPAPPPPEGLSVADLVTLSLAHLLDIAGGAVASLGGDGASLEVCLGSPQGEAEDPRYAAALSRMGRLARGITAQGGLPAGGGLTPQGARRLLDAAAEAADAGGAPGVQIIPELDAALCWYHQSPFVSAGRFVTLDIGAGFARGASFTMDPGPAPRTKGAVSCFGVLHRPFGADAIDMALARAAGVPDPTFMRGDEGTLIVRHRPQCFEEVRGVMAAAQELYQAAHRMAWDAQPGLWGDYGLLLIGGGSWIRVIREHLLSPAHAEMAMGPSLLNSGRPEGLLELDGRPFAEDPDFLMVAYGLARGGVPAPG